MPEKAIVITTIFTPASHLIKMGAETSKRDIKFIIIGDIKTPKDYYINGTEYYDIERQHAEYGDFAKILPLNHYARKNIGYLAAIKSGVKLLQETDDDNIPYDNYYNEIPYEIEIDIYKSERWINAYSLFSDEDVWPRGLSLKHIRNNNLKISRIKKKIKTLIIQGLSDRNPDVDAIYRLVGKTPIYFNREKIIGLNKHTWSPFNSQNTIFREEVFPLLYLPSNCSFRMTDIWRSFIAQRCLWELDSYLIFQYPTVYQNRNEHDILKDFKEEIPGYLENDKIVDLLESISFKSKDVKENILICYNKMIKAGYFPEEEFNIVKMWIKELNA